MKAGNILCAKNKVLVNLHWVTSTYFTQYFPNEAIYFCRLSDCSKTTCMVINSLHLTHQPVVYRRDVYKRPTAADAC